MTEIPSSTGGAALLQNIKEILSHEPVIIVPITERNLPVFEPVLTDLTSASGMLPMTGNKEESIQDWVTHTKDVWVFGTPNETNRLDPEAAEGFVSVYEPEHLDKINEWQAAKGKRVYEKEQVLELSSYGKESSTGVVAEDSATKLALDKVFNGLNYKDVRAVSVWVTHDQNNQLDPVDVSRTIALGGKKLGSLKYDASETVDSTCFVIPRQAFLDTLTGGHK